MKAEINSVSHCNTIKNKVQNLNRIYQFYRIRARVTRVRRITKCPCISCQEQNSCTGTCKGKHKVSKVHESLFVFRIKSKNPTVCISILHDSWIYEKGLFPLTLQPLELTHLILAQGLDPL